MIQMIYICFKGWSAKQTQKPATRPFNLFVSFRILKMTFFFLLLQQANCGYVIILMALYWCTECIPLAVTALLPVILFPFLGIMEAEEVTSDKLLSYGSQQQIENHKVCQNFPTNPLHVKRLNFMAHKSFVQNNLI